MILTKERIDEIFEQAEEQADYILGLYKEVIPDFDERSGSIKPPVCNPKLWLYISRKAMKWDSENAGSFPGGAWMNHGFSTVDSDELGDWEVKEREGI